MVVVGETAFEGVVIKGAARVRVESAAEVSRLVTSARQRRDAYAERAAAAQCAAAYFEFEISHKIRAKPKAGGPSYRCVARSDSASIV